MDSSFQCGKQCIEGLTYQKVACNPGSKTLRDCGECSDTLSSVQAELGITKYIRRPCSLFLDADIQPCSPQRECPAGEYWSKCDVDRDGMCVPCTNTVCERGKFLSECLADRDAECVACNASVRCSSSGNMMYRSECEYSSDYECRNCSSECIPGVTFEKQACTNVTNRVCEPCSFLGACPPNTYKRSACTPKQDTVCYPCSKHPCPEGYFESSPCNATSDRICSRCTQECPAGQFLAEDCSEKADTQCKPCSSPSCEDGKAYRTSCSGRNDSVCMACSFPEGCPAGTFQNQSCTPLTDRQCKTCATCIGNNYMKKACTATEDTQCGYCGTDSALQIAAWRAYVKGINANVAVDIGCYESLPSGISLNCHNKASDIVKPLDAPERQITCVPFASGPCGDGQYESKRCTNPAASSAPSTDPRSGDVYDFSKAVSEVYFVFDTYIHTKYTNVSYSYNYCPNPDTPMWLYHPDLMHVCSPCRSPCNPYSLIKAEYEVSPCTGSSWNVPGKDRVCSECKTVCESTPEFPSNYIVQRCSQYRDAVCRSEVVCTCPAGWYRKTDCIFDGGYAVNATCEKITASCKKGFYKEADATEMSDTDCRTCPSTCPAGFYQRSPIPAGLKMSGACPFDCAKCSVCGVGSYQVAACSATNNTVCQSPCSDCPEDTYKIGECEGTMNTRCWDCRPAPKVLFCTFLRFMSLRIFMHWAVCVSRRACTSRRRTGARGRGTASPSTASTVLATPIEAVQWAPTSRSSATSRKLSTATLTGHPARPVRSDCASHGRG